MAQVPFEMIACHLSVCFSGGWEGSAGPKFVLEFWPGAAFPAPLVELIGVEEMIVCSAGVIAFQLYFLLCLYQLPIKVGKNNAGVFHNVVAHQYWFGWLFHDWKLVFKHFQGG